MPFQIGWKSATTLVDGSGSQIGNMLVGATPAAAGGLRMPEATANGTNSMSLQAPALMAADRSINLQDANYTLPVGAANTSTLMDLQTPQTILSTKTFGAGGGLNLGTGAGTLGLVGGFFCSRNVATTGGAHATPHGLGRTPSLFFVVLDGMPAGALAITAISADGTNINWTDSSAGGTVTIFAC